ncbi:hypothetical protein DB88DRAFT_485565 [Papiliotrema laurentii]|uniref:DUF159-domain-containing protein n=1 Tax=Papiliotrema laurentii TaxID=5418 RepID=A0AAD9L740_PAPLA|nr:hypothetical protein DB88DRAFT_485565 [Papiliotrema laurentii]
MCGRYALALSNEEVYESLQNQLPGVFRRQARWEREQDYRPNYNIAPRQRAPVIHRDEESGEPIIETMQWGLIPHWTKHPPTGALNTINARSESLLDPSSGGMWHALKAHKRCVVPAQGYYEWHKRPSAKIAHFTRLPLTPKSTNAKPPVMFFAGLYDVVKYVSPVESRFERREGDDREPYPTGNPVPLATFTILTTTPAKDIEWLHDRMPCILRTEEEVKRWLDLGEVMGWKEGRGGTGELLKGTRGLDCYPVNPEVGKIGTNSPTYIQPVSERSDGIKSFFQKQQPSPAKPKAVKSEKVKAEEPVLSAEKVKEEAEGIKAEIGEGDEEKGLGDDSNAPNPEVKDEPVVNEDDAKLSGVSPSKRKRPLPEEEQEERNGKGQEKRGGRQTKVIRKASGDDNKEQPSITNFFHSPSAKKAKQEPPSKSKTRAKKGH